MVKRVDGEGADSLKARSGGEHRPLVIADRIPCVGQKVNGERQEIDPRGDPHIPTVKHVHASFMEGR